MEEGKDILKQGSKAFVVENCRKVRPVFVVSESGGLYVVRFTDGSGTRLRRYRLYLSEMEAETAMNQSNRRYRSKSPHVTRNVYECAYRSPHLMRCVEKNEREVPVLCKFW